MLIDLYVSGYPGPVRDPPQGRPGLPEWSDFATRERHCRGEAKLVLPVTVQRQREGGRHVFPGSRLGNYPDFPARPVAATKEFNGR